ncbi:MAG: hypothetical protein IJ719_12265 [Clostridia bacterium]|nr:hypothetical protein [Clostridia bacterium]
MKKLVSILVLAMLCLGILAGAMAEGKSIDDVWAKGSTVYFHVPAKAGGGTDLFTRYLTQALTEAVPGVNFIVNNYEVSEVGMETVKSAKPDGLNLATCHGGAIIQWFTGSSNVNIKDDTKVVGILNLGGPQAIIAGPNAPYKNFTELAEYVKANPGKLMIGCSLGGTTQMIFVSFIEAIAGDSTLATYVQCASEADKLTNVASGAIDLANCSIPNALSYEADGRLTILGTIGPKVATVSSMSELLGIELGNQYASGPEQGVDSATWDSNYYVLVPKDTPDDVCEAINSALMKAAEVQSYIDGNHAMATFTSPIDYQGSIDALNTEWAFLDELVGNMGLKVR